MSLEKKKMQVELMRVQAGKAELELKIEERLDEIERLKEHIKIQEKKESELQDKLK
jgi:hypothetical protein